MKLIFVEYLASLKERGELDVILPDLLSEIGMSVFSRPAIGTRQYGVDVGAVGGAEGEEKVFLISIKPRDLKRPDWDTGQQSLRTSLNEIRDVYIPKHLPGRYKDLPVVIVLCIGGELHEGVRTNVESYIDNHTREGLEFEVWNGDMLAHLLLSGVLRENALPETWRSDFRKAVALVDEPDASFEHFRRLVSSISDACEAAAPAHLTAIRQIYLGLWTLYVWGRNADNIEAAYLCSERAVLIAWELTKEYFKSESEEARQIGQSMGRLIELHIRIADDYITTYVVPRAKTPHGLSAAVPSPASLDVNLRLFDLVGRIGSTGLWLLHSAGRLGQDGKEEEEEEVGLALQRMAQLLADIIANNPILFTPIKDSQAIDINIACLFLKGVGSDPVIREWIGKTAEATMFAFRSHGLYPCVYNEYRDLIDHPRQDDDYRVKATAASLLIPTLAVWAAVTPDAETLGRLADFVAGPYAHSTLQLLYPGSDTETHLYRNGGVHGLNFTEIEIQRSGENLLAPIKLECEASDAFTSLSAVNFGLWPLVILASRHYRVPVPPQFWGL